MRLDDNAEGGNSAASVTFLVNWDGNVYSFAGRQCGRGNSTIRFEKGVQEGVEGVHCDSDFMVKRKLLGGAM